MGKITYRGLHKEDEARIGEWVKADPDHQTVDPDFFRMQRLGVSHIVLEDDGVPVFYVTVENIARVHIQFNPGGLQVKNVRALKEGFTWLIQSLKQRGYQELIFNSKVPKLIRFCRSVLGFVKSDDDFKTRL